MFKQLPSHPSIRHFQKLGMRSSREVAIEQWLASLGYKPMHGKQHGFEIDIWFKLSGRVIGLEFDGVRFHCSSTARRTRGITLKPKDYHYQKTLMALKSGVELYHFWDIEPLESVKSQILKIIRGESISDTDVDKNPSLICRSHLEPRYVFEESAHFHKQGVLYPTKPLCWSSSEVQIYEIYTAGYVTD